MLVYPGKLTCPLEDDEISFQNAPFLGNEFDSFIFGGIPEWADFCWWSRPAKWRQGQERLVWIRARPDTWRKPGVIVIITHQVYLKPTCTKGPSPASNSTVRYHQAIQIAGIFPPLTWKTRVRLRVSACWYFVGIFNFRKMKGKVQQ